MSETNGRKQLIKALWDSAEQLWSNSDLKPSEYAMPVLGLVFLKYADHKFAHVDKLVQEKYGNGRIGITKAHYHQEGAIYLKPEARYDYLLNLPEDVDLGKAIDEAMREIEEENESIQAPGLPKNYSRISNDVLRELLRHLNSITNQYNGDIFGLVYEEFLGNFHKTTGEKGGEFFTPTSIVRLIVEIIEPYHGKIFDPACGSGGMFVQSAKFIANHKKDPTRELSIFGQEIAGQNVQIANMNLSIHGLQGNIKIGNTYYEDIHKSVVADKVGKFDFVMANPPFNSKKINKEKLKGDKRFPFGLPKPDNGNYIWIQIFYSALNETGKAGFVMANSAGDAGNTEKDIREALVNEGVVDAIVAVGSNFFHTVTLPCTLWFLDKAKAKDERKNKILFLDARDFYRDIDRAHREFTDEQLEFLGDIVRLYHGKDPEYPGNALLKEHFPDMKYQDIKGLCKIATLDEVIEQDYSLNPGRYVGIKPPEPMPKEEFEKKIGELESEFSQLRSESGKLEKLIEINIKNLY
jgi:type I restriction enzyme M protein